MYFRGEANKGPVTLDQRPGTVPPSALAALFAAGAIDSVLPFLPGQQPPATGQAAGELAARA
jgi:hypothetical protein